MLLTPLDSSIHDVKSFCSGNDACDGYLRAQARKHRSKCLVMVDGATIQAFGSYRLAIANFDGEKRKVIWIDYLARDLENGRGAGMEMLLRLLIRIHKDPRSHDDVYAVMLDSKNSDDDTENTQRWDFFTRRAGFYPFHEDGNAFGYAAMPIADAFNIAIRAEKERKT